MRKYLLTAITVALYSLAASAQVADTAFASVRYTLKHIMDTTQPENPQISKMVLHLGKNMSNYTRDNTVTPGTGGGVRNVVVSDVAVGSGSVSAGTISASSMPRSDASSPFAVLGNYYKDINTSKMSFMAFAGGKVFSVEENTPAINWNITQETKDIQGLSCQKAVGDFKGRTYEAWFCSALPFSNGPWKLGGLPGLIIEASDTKKEVMFQFVSYENASATDKQVAIEIPTTVVKTTPKEFKQYQDALQKDRQAAMGGNSTFAGGMVVSGMSLSLTGPDGKPVKPRQLNNPIEKN